MALDTEGFDQKVVGGIVSLIVNESHSLIKLCNSLPWQELLEIILPDLKRTNKLLWWTGRPLRVRIHLGVYLLQQLFNLTDREAEDSLRDNAAFRLFCGFQLLKKWHVPDHTKIEEFRSRLSPETQRVIANHIAIQAVKFKYANPANLDVDSTIQEANIQYPSIINLLIKLAILGKSLIGPLTTLCGKPEGTYGVNLKKIKSLALYFFSLKRQVSSARQDVLKKIWGEVCLGIYPILKDSHILVKAIQIGKHFYIRRKLEQLQWRGHRLLEKLYDKLFENKNSDINICSLHAYDVHVFNKNKLNKGIEFGRNYQLARIEGNFLYVGKCESLHMPDAQSLPRMVIEHQNLFGKEALKSISTDKGYYSNSNQFFLEEEALEEIGLPRPNRFLDAPYCVQGEGVMEKLYNRRAGIEPLIGHLKRGWQMGRSRMKSDTTTLSAGYSSVLGFNLRQLKRNVVGEVKIRQFSKTLSNRFCKNVNSQVA